jgi:hypothetical protein
MTDAHQDVAGVVEAIERYRSGSDEAVYSGPHIANILQMWTDRLSKALSEADSRYNTAVGSRIEWRHAAETWQAKAEAAESRLAEAMGILEFYAEPFEYIKKHGLEEQTPDFYDELDTGDRARRFINAGKE